MNVSRAQRRQCIWTASAILSLIGCLQVSPEARSQQPGSPAQEPVNERVTRLILELDADLFSVREAAEDWKNGIEKARRNARGIKHYTEERYEELVADPEPVLRRICEFVSLEFEPAMLSYHERADERMTEISRDFERSGQSAIPADVRAKQHQRVASPPQTQRAGRWRSEMTAADRDLFESVAGELLAELGYDVGGRRSS